jgi:hypothetical protein
LYTVFTSCGTRKAIGNSNGATGCKTEEKSANLQDMRTTKKGAQKGRLQNTNNCVTNQYMQVEYYVNKANKISILMNFNELLYYN